MRTIVCAFCFILIALGAVSCKQKPKIDLAESKPPLYDAFMAFCAGSKSNLDEIETAIKPTGATHRPRENSAGPDGKTISVEFWDNVMVGGHKLSVTASVIDANAPSRRKVHCSINSWAQDDESITALRKWITVSGDSLGEGNTDTVYAFIGDKDKHERYDEKRGTAEGSWMISLLLFNHNAPAITSLHYFPYRYK